MKIKMHLILGGLFLMSQVATVQAAAQTLTVSATVPQATGISITVTPVNATTNVFGTPSTSATTLPFGTLTYNAANGIYLPSQYFAIDLGSTGGAGSPIVAVTYVEGTNPNLVATNGLGTKTTATFALEQYTSPTTSPIETISTLGKKRLIDLTGTAGEVATIPSGDWERVYVGVWTGSTTAPADPSNGKPFVNTDNAGTYTGTLTFTVVTL